MTPWDVIERCGARESVRSPIDVTDPDATVRGPKLVCAMSCR